MDTKSLCVLNLIDFPIPACYEVLPRIMLMSLWLRHKAWTSGSGAATFADLSSLQTSLTSTLYPVRDETRAGVWCIQTSWFCLRGAARLHRRPGRPQTETAQAPFLLRRRRQGLPTRSLRPPCPSRALAQRILPRQRGALRRRRRPPRVRGPRRWDTSCFWRVTSYEPSPLNVMNIYLIKVKNINLLFQALPVLKP